MAEVSAGDKAPDFTLGSVDGNGTVKLSDYTVEPTLLVFWVSWRPHCQRELPIIQKIYADLGSKGMNTVGVSVDSEVEDARGFVKDYGLRFPNAFAGTADGRKVLDTYGIDGVPTILVIAKGELVKARFGGETAEKTLRGELAKLGVR